MPGQDTWHAAGLGAPTDNDAVQEKTASVEERTAGFTRVMQGELVEEDTAGALDVRHGTGRAHAHRQFGVAAPVARGKARP